MTLTDVYVTDNLSTGVPVKMVSLRPDVRSFEFALNRANAHVGITKANMYPVLSITAGAGLNSFRATNWFNIPASLFGMVSGGIVQPLLQKRQLKPAYHLALVDREKTVVQFRQSVLYAVGEVSDALVRIEKLAIEQHIATSRVNTSQKAIASARSLFASGMANYLEVITTHPSALQSELELARITREGLSARVELYRALGGGWK